MTRDTAQALLERINAAQGLSIGARHGVLIHARDNDIWGVGIFTLRQEDIDQGRLNIGAIYNRFPSAVFYDPAVANNGLRIESLL